MWFRITQKLETRLDGQRLLYIVTADHDGKEILIKLTRRYSKELHELCASVNRAPKLLGFEKLSGDWFGVAMEYFSSADRVLESNSLHSCGESWLKDIDEIVSAFHAQDYIMGTFALPTLSLTMTGYSFPPQSKSIRTGRWNSQKESSITAYGKSHGRC